MADSWHKKLKTCYQRLYHRRMLNPLATRLRQVLGDAGESIPVLLVSYNNGRYVAHSVEQLERFGIKPIIVDNASRDPETRRVLDAIEASGAAHVLRSSRNFGHMVGFLEPIYDVLPDVFAYSDPDLRFSPDLPEDFLETLAALTTRYAVFKAGCALSIPADAELYDVTVACRKVRPIPIDRRFSIREWEAHFWRMRLAHESLEIYAARLDTTFAVYRKSNFRDDFYDAVRVAGAYGVIHLPWFPQLDLLSKEERANYLKGNRSTSWVAADAGKEAGRGGDSRG